MYYRKMIQMVVSSLSILSLSACSVILGPQEGGTNTAPPATQNSVSRSQANVNGNVSKTDQNSAANDFVKAQSGNTVSATVANSNNGMSTDSTVTVNVPANQTQSQAVSQADTGVDRTTESSAVASTNTTVNKDTHANRVQQMGSGHLAVKAPYNQVWSQVGKVLPGSGYQIMDTDSALGNYSVSDTTGSGGVIKHDTPVYMIHLEKQGDNTLVTVSASNNQSGSGMSQLYNTLKNKLQ